METFMHLHKFKSSDSAHPSDAQETGSNVEVNKNCNAMSLS